MGRIASNWKKVRHQRFVLIDFYDVPEKSVEIFYDKLKEEYPRLIEKDFGSTHHYLYNFIRSFEIWIALIKPPGAAGTYYGRANRESNDVSKRAGSFETNIFMTGAQESKSPFNRRIKLPKNAAEAAEMLKGDKTATHEFGHGVQTAIWDSSPSAKEGTPEGKKGKHTQESKKFILLSNMILSPAVREYYEWLGPLLEKLEGDPIRPLTIGDGLAFALNKTAFGEQKYQWQKKFAEHVERVIPMKNAILIDTDKIPPKALRLLKQRNIVKAKEHGNTKQEKVIGWKKHSYGTFHPVQGYLIDIPVKHQSQTMKDALADAVGNADDWILAVMAPYKAASSGKYGEIATPAAENKAGYGAQKTIPKHKVDKRPRHLETNPYSFRKKRGANIADVDYNIGYTSKGGSSNTGDKWNRQLTEFDAEFKAKSRAFMKEMAENGIAYAVGDFNYQNVLIALMEENVSGVSKLLQTKSGVLQMFKRASNKWQTDVLNHPAWNYKKKANDRFEIYAEVMIDAMMDDEVQDLFEKVTGGQDQGSTRSTADFIVGFKRANPFRQKLDEVLGQKLKKLLGL
jgi:hypothetical protein